eukprot:6211990-Pleurochrysis_carterae.AAC.11
MPQARSGATGQSLLPTSMCRATRRRRSLTSSWLFPSKRVCVSRFPFSRLTTPSRSRPRNPTASLPPCSLTACPLRRPHATVGTPFALVLPPGCNARAVCLTSFKRCVGGSRPNRSLSVAELRRPSTSGGSLPRTRRTLTPPRLSYNVAVGSDAHFSQLARAASALDSASASTPTVAAPVAVSASSCPPPNAGVDVAASLPASRTQGMRLHLPAPARPSPGDLVFTPRRLLPAYACNEHGGNGWTGRDFFSHEAFRPRRLSLCLGRPRPPVCTRADSPCAC